ncbi:hypothetical protein PUN28_003261 [Cardiocondyla obscurior]|uniref:Uncharacterized protein n=1 Tax=Cardiocondyla obscurior TaxID=286306 RepID=A0AAW2GJY5_9HYME
MPPPRQSKLHHVRLRLRFSLITKQFTVLFQEQRERSRIIRPFNSFHSFTRPRNQRISDRSRNEEHENELSSRNLHLSPINCISRLYHWLHKRRLARLTLDDTCKQIILPR